MQLPVSRFPRYKRLCLGQPPETTTWSTHEVFAICFDLRAPGKYAGRRGCLTTSYKTTAGSVATGLAISLPLLATGITIAKHDPLGAAELLAGTILSVGITYALNNLVWEDRPDGASDHSFPAETSVLAASSSAFLWGR